MIDCESETPNQFPQRIVVRTKHSLRADVGEAVGSDDSAPSPHDYFDAALVACKTTTAVWYARRANIPLETVEAHVERDDSEERAGKYKLKVRVDFHGPMTDEQRSKLHAAVAKCPIHKLMATAEVTIETEEMNAGAL